MTVVTQRNTEFGTESLIYEITNRSDFIFDLNGVRANLALLNDRSHWELEIGIAA